MQNELTVAVVGIGSWGKGLVRHFATAERSRLRWLCDLDEAALARHAKLYPEAATSVALEDVLLPEALNKVLKYPKLTARYPTLSS